MLRVLRENGSPAPVFETDDDRAALVLRLPVHAEALAMPVKSPPVTPPVETETPGAESGPSSARARPESPLAAKILLALHDNPVGKAALAALFGHKTVSGELHKQIKQVLFQELLD